MRISRLLGMMVSAAIIASPVIAQAQVGAPNSASKLSLANTPQRAGAKMAGVSRGEGNMTWLIIGGVVAAGVLLWLILDDDGDDDPVSP